MQGRFATAGSVEDEYRMAFFKAPFPYGNASKLGIASSLAIHASLLALLLLMPSAKPALLSKTIQIRLGHQDSFSTAEPREEAKPAAAKPVLRKKSDPSRSKAHQEEIATDLPKPEKLSSGSDPVTESTQNRPVPSMVVDSLSSFSNSQTKNAGKAAPVQNAAESKGGKAGDRSITETSFGATGAPAFIHRVLPVYPSLARRLGKEGRVVLKLLIDRHGKLRGIEVLESAGFGFLEAAIAAAKQSTYAPAIRNGEAVASAAILPVRFRLDER